MFPLYVMFTVNGFAFLSPLQAKTRMDVWNADEREDRLLPGGSCDNFHRSDW